MKKFTVFLFVILSLVVFAACENSKSKKAAALPTPETQAAAAIQTGKSVRPLNAELAPDFEVTDSITGKKLKLADYKGKVVILDFWATWCPPCKAEIPFFIELEKQYGKDGLAILGAALDDATKVKNFYKNNAMNYPVFISDQQMAINYGGVQGIPTTFIIDKDGYIREKFVGFRPKEIFEEAFLSLK